MIKFFPDVKTAVEIFGVSIAWYAILIVGGAFIAYELSARSIRKMGYDNEIMENLFVGALVSGVIGARLWYMLFIDFGGFIANPMSFFEFRDGGLAIHGGLILGVLFAYFYARRKNLNFIHWADAIVPNILVAQAIGRWGNFLNQEAFGRVVSESYYRYFPSFIKNMMFINGEFQEPTFLYESVLNIVGWVLIVYVLKKSKDLKRGQLTSAYLIWYGVVRLIIEGLRSDALFWNLGFVQLRIAQVISIAFIVVGLMGYYGVFKKFYPRSKPVIIMDFDGTIMDTQQVIQETFVEVFRRNKPDFEMTDEILSSFIGPTLYDSFGRFFKENEVDDLVSEYRALNIELHEAYVKPMENVIEVLEQLKSEGYVLGIVSSKVRAPIDYALELTNMSHLFDFVYGFDDYENAKPDPEGIIKALDRGFYDRSQSIYIGDTPSDIEAGRRAGSFTIGYIFDKNREQALRDSKPNAMISDWNELIAILEGDHEWTYNLI